MYRSSAVTSAVSYENLRNRNFYACTPCLSYVLLKDGLPTSWIRREVKGEGVSLETWKGNRRFYSPDKEKDIKGNDKPPTA